MVAYSFRPQFVDPILAGLKRQTIRAERKRHAREGERLQLYTGMRTRRCRLIGTTTCIGATNLRLFLAERRAESLDTGNAWTTAEETDAFAAADGFQDWAELKRFWAAEHPGLATFSGVMICWLALDPTRAAA